MRYVFAVFFMLGLTSLHGMQVISGSSGRALVGSLFARKLSTSLPLSVYEQKSVEFVSCDFDQSLSRDRKKFIEEAQGTIMKLQSA